MQDFFRTIRTRRKSLKKLMVITISLSAFVSLIMVALISVSALLKLQNNRTSSSVGTYLNLVTASFEQDYMFLLQVSEQMIAQGSVGRYVETYWNSDDSYERLSLSKKIPETINLITYSNLRCGLVMYYSSVDGEHHFQTQPVGANFDIEQLPILMKSPSAYFQPLHTSLSRISDNLVLSVTRHTEIANQNIEIYAEIKTDYQPGLTDLPDKKALPYYFIQTNYEDKILYSDLDENFAHEATFPLNGKTSGGIAGYKWYAQKSQMGFVNIVLIPKYTLNFELNTWLKQMGVLIVFWFAWQGIVTAIFHKRIYKPMNMLIKEMSLVGNGYLENTTYHSDINEFDALFTQFDHMKKQINLLIKDNRIKDEQKYKMKIDMLYYQINPHFLMNSLNSVRWMAILHNDKGVDDYISKLIYILGYNLGKIDHFTTLETEIKMLNTYVKLMQVRYDFRYEIVIEDNVSLGIPFARLLLQPIAENAIQHGLDEGDLFRVSIRLHKSNAIQIECYNQGKVLDQSTIEGILSDVDAGSESKLKGIGLTYVKHVLESTYGNDSRLEIESLPAYGTTVSIYIPYNEENK